MIVLFNKPYGVMSQFSPDDKHRCLAEFIPIKRVYPAGRLDHDSEGLLVLTDDGKLQAQISSPKHKMPKTYWAQVDREVSDEAIEQLRSGVQLKDGMTKPAKVTKIDPPKELWERVPPIRYRKSVPTSWIEITLKEGKNRQVRRMTAAVGFPTLRLIRVSIGPWTVFDLPLGEYRIID